MFQSQNVRVYDEQGSFIGRGTLGAHFGQVSHSICAVQACRFVMSAVANGYVWMAY